MTNGVFRGYRYLMAIDSAASKKVLISKYFSKM